MVTVAAGNGEAKGREGKARGWGERGVQEKDGYTTNSREKAKFKLDLNQDLSSGALPTLTIANKETNNTSFLSRPAVDEQRYT